MYFPKALLFFLTLFTLTTLRSSAQSSGLQDKRIVLNYHYGFVLKNKRETAHLANQRPSGIELELNFQTIGKKEWQALYNYPEVGVSVQYWVMDSRKKLGNQFGIVPYFQKHIFKTQRSSLLYRVGVGLGYVEKRFDLYTNNQNNLISNRINYVLNGAITYKYRISKAFSLNTGIGLTHFSNGGFKKPNQGINIPNCQVGLAYHFEETDPVVRKNFPPFEKGLLFMVFGGIASKSEIPIGSKNYMVSTLSFYAGNKVNRKSTLLGGIDCFYDSSMKVWADSSEVNNKLNFSKVGLVLGHELAIGNLALVTHVGYLVFCPVQVLSKLYQRYGLKYYVKENFFVSATMKANLARADFVEFGVGYRFLK